jgi:uncharacterized protein (TIGR02186 family)
MYTPTAQARPIVADLAIRAIDIDHDFSGIEILLFGARGDVGDIVVVVRGPKQDYTVRKKERIGGIWVNRDAVSFDQTEGFYAVASSRPLEELKNEQLLKRLDVGLGNKSFGTLVEPENIDNFRDAFVRYKQTQGLYSTGETPISFWGDTLFRTVLSFPKNIVKGWYIAEIYLFSDGQLVGMQATPLRVKQTGFEAFVYDSAHEHPFLYGLCAVIIALFAGWAASALFHRI